jgi:hypothetical protein
VTEPGASAALFADRLQRLYEAAGSPEYRLVVERAARQRPAIHLSDSSLSDWLTGKSVPSNQVAVRFLVTYLQDRVARRTGHRPEPVEDWLRLHRQARLARRAGGRPARRAASPPAGANRKIPPELAGLLRVMSRYVEEHPYAQPGQFRKPLSAVYVSQSVASPVEAVRQVRNPQLDEIEMVQEDRRVTRLAQPFDEVFGQYDHLVIEGAAGLGKSTLGRFLVGDLVKTLLDGTDGSFPGADLVPIMLPARVLARYADGIWGEALHAAVTAEYGLLSDGVVPAGTFLQPVAGRNWLFVVDALDEIPDQTDRDRLLKAISIRMASPGAARFLVTSRPLEPGEITQLQGPRVGFFELQPFDAAALEAFAQRHFNPDETARGAAAAADFLAQVRLSGLDQVLNVPLLATVAAEVFTSKRGDQPLPSSRYELYQAYISRFSTRTASAAEVFGATASARFCAWLDEHRTALLEVLAVEYTSSETPLAELAAVQVRQHSPAPVSELPAGWEIALGDWLARSGLLGRHGVRLRFLHQTFAEHLAATARARVLPDAFTSADPAWRELLSQFLFGDTAAEQTLLHHLHLRGPANGLLAHLQARSQNEREKAGQLIVKGAPCSAAELGAFLDMTAGQILADADLDLRELAGLTVHPMVQEQLGRWLRDEWVPAGARIAVIDLLRERNPGVRPEGAVLLAGFIADVTLPDSVRARAARALALLGEPFTEAGVNALRRIAADRSAAGGSRNEAAMALASVGASHHAEAVVQLESIAEDASVSGWDRQAAAENIARLSSAFRSRAADLLYRLCVDPLLLPSYRRAAAEALASMGGENRQRAIAALSRRIPGSSREAEETFSSAAALLLGTDGRETAAQLLVELFENPWSSSQARHDAAKALADLGGRHRANAARFLRDLAVAGSTVRGSVRWSAADTLTGLGRNYRELSVEALTSVAEDMTLPPYTRRRAARLLARQDGAPRATAVGALRHLVTSATVDLDDRAEAALELATLDDQQRDWTTAYFQGLLMDPLAALDFRILGAAVLVALQPHSTAAEREALYALARTADGHHAGRMLAANALAETTGEKSGRAAELLLAAATDPASEVSARQVAASRLAEVSERHRQQAAAILRNLAMGGPAMVDADSLSVPNLLVVYAGMGETYRKDASTVLRTALADTWREEESLAWIVYRLTAMVPGAAAETADTLAALLEEPLWDRTGLYFDDVAMLDRCRPGLAFKTFLRLQSIDGFDSFHRCSMAIELVKYENRYRAAAAAALRAAAAELAEGEADRRLSLGFAETLETGRRQPFIAALIAVLEDPATRPNQRRQVAAELDEEGPAYRQHVVAAYRSICSDPRAAASTRLAAMERILPLDPLLVARTAESLMWDVTEPVDTRVQAARRFMEAGGDPGILARLLTACGRETRLEPKVRLDVGDELVALGEEQTVEAAAVFTELLGDPLASVRIRVDAGCRLARLGSDEALSAASIAEGLLASRDAGPADRAVGAGLLAWLRPECRILATSLIAGSLPGSPFTGQRDVAEFLGSLREGRSEASIALSAIVMDPCVADDDRFVALESLAVMGDEVVRTTLVAGELAADPTVGAEVRRRAAVLAVRLDGGCRDRTAEVLRQIVASATSDGRQRVDSALRYASAQPSGRSWIVEFLEEMAGDGLQDSAVRREAALALSRFGDAHMERATDILEMIALKSGESIAARLGAVRQMLNLPGKRRRAMRVVRACIADPLLESDDRAFLLAESALVESSDIPAAIEALGPVAIDPQVSEWDRWASADLLLAMGPAGFDTAMTALRRLAEEPTADASQRHRAALLLYQGTAGPRSEAIRLFRMIATDRFVSAAERLGAIRQLLRLAPAGEDVTAILSDLVVEPGVPADKRGDAALTMARLGEFAQTQAIRLLAERASSSPPQDQLILLTTLGKIGSPGRQLAGLGLRRLGGSASAAGVLHRAIAAGELARLEGGHDGAAARQLILVAGDRGHTANERLWAVGALARLGPVHHSAAAELLQGVAVDHGYRVWERAEAARMLARLGAGHRAAASDLLLALYRQKGADPWEAADCAVEYGSLNADDASTMTERLAQLTEGASADAPQIRHVVAHLLKYGPTARAAAAAALIRVATDGSAVVRTRAEAAADLVRMGDEYGPDAFDILQQLTVGGSGTAADRAQALAVLAEVRPDERAAAVAALQAVAEDSAEVAGVRRRAAEVLVDLCVGSRKLGLDLLRSLVRDDKKTNVVDQALSMAALTQWDATAGHTAIDALLELDFDSLSSLDQIRVAENLADVTPDPTYGAALLHRIARDADRAPGERCRAYAGWVRWSPAWNTVGRARLA